MWNKLLVVKEFDTDIEVPRDVTKLLNEIQGISHQMESNTSVYDAIDQTKVKY